MQAFDARIKKKKKTQVYTADFYFSKMRCGYPLPVYTFQTVHDCSCIVLEEESLPNQSNRDKDLNYFFIWLPTCEIFEALCTKSAPSSVEARVNQNSWP